MQPNLVLIRGLPDGKVEWIRLDGSIGHVSAAPNETYTLIDRAAYEAPKTLVAERVGENLVLEVEGAEAVVIDGFFSTAHVAFYPTTNIAGGAGPFSGAPLTADSPVLAGSTPAEQVLWSAEPMQSSNEEVEPPVQTASSAGSGGTSPMLWVGLGVGAVGLAALAGGGGGSGGGESGGGAAVTITSGATAAAVAESTVVDQVVYRATASTAAGTAATFSLAASGDAAAFTIDANTGEVRLSGNPDYEAKPSYTFTVVATDAANNSASQAVSLAINNLDEVAPSITSSATAAAISENSGAGQVVYTVTSTDTGDISSGSTTYSLSPVDDSAAFSINASTGAVTLTADPDFEAKPTYNFTVVATDASNNSSEQAVSLAIGNVADTPVTITSATSAAAIDENSGDNQNVYTVTATATTGTDLTYSLAEEGDADAFSINADTGVVRLDGDPNFETKPSYNFTVVATDAANNTASQAVSLAINNLDEVAPTITSSATAAAISENSGAGQIVYRVTSTDTGDISTGSTTYRIANGGDASAFTINANTGEVRLTGNPNYETKPNYNFTVVATDAANHRATKAVSLAINNLDDTAPTITSGNTAQAINENSGAGQIIYTVTSTDTADVRTGNTTYSLRPVNDSGSFNINATTGAVTLIANPNDETKGSYSFTVAATDTAGNSREQAVTLGINDLDEVAPTITSSGTANTIAENSGAGQIVYTVTSTDTDVVTGSTTYSLRPVGDWTAFSINANTGAVTLVGNPDFETKSSYSFTVAATDAANNSSERAVSLTINDVADETAPTLFSSSPADDATGVPRETDIVLVFDEDVTAGSGNIIIRDIVPGPNLDLTIPINDPQIAISGNQVTINPSFDLRPGANYAVRIDPGVITDLAGNAFGGINNNNTLDFETVFDIFGLSEPAQLSSLDSRTFQTAQSNEIDIRAATADATSNALGSSDASASSLDLSSDARIQLVGDAPSSTSSLLADADGGSLENAVSDATHFGTSMSGAFGNPEEGNAAALPPLEFPVIISTSQGLA